jgi:LysM repeat protein
LKRAHSLVRLAPVALLFFTAGCFRPAGESIEPTSGAVLPLASQTILSPSAAAETSEAGSGQIPVTIPSDSLSVDTPEVTPGPAVTLAQNTAQTPGRTPAAAITAFPTLVSATSTPRFITPGSPLGPVTPDTATPTSNAPPTSTPSGLITPTSLPGTEDGDCTYIVQSGDSLYHIATTHDLTVEDMLNANPDLVGDPPILQVGQSLQMPDCDPDAEPAQTGAATSVSATAAQVIPAGGEVYTVQAGDTLYSISLHYGVTVQEIIDANNLPNPDRLDVGQQIIIPPPSS